MPTAGGVNVSAGAEAEEDEDFGMENEILQAQLESATQDSSQVEAKMSEISNLLNLFTTKVCMRTERLFRGASNVMTSNR
jgi:hypothetical protein